MQQGLVVLGLVLALRFLPGTGPLKYVFVGGLAGWTVLQLVSDMWLDHVAVSPKGIRQRRPPKGWRAREVPWPEVRAIEVQNRGVHRMVVVETATPNDAGSHEWPVTVLRTVRGLPDRSFDEAVAMLKSARPA